MTFESDFDAVLTVKARRDRLDDAIGAMAADSESPRWFASRGAFAGWANLTALALAVEIGDWDRFTGSTIGSFVGPVPSEHSSGGSRVQSSITKPATPMSAGCLSRASGTTAPATSSGRPCATGGSWQHRPPEPVAMPGARRLHARWTAFRARRKRHAVANVAVARELAGWCWSLAVLEA